MNLYSAFRSSARRRAMIVGSNVVLTALAYYLAFAVGAEFHVSDAAFATFARTLPYLLIVRVLVAHRLGLDRGYWQHVGLRDLLQLTMAVVLGSLLFPVILVAFDQLQAVPVSVFVIEAMLWLALTSGVRVAARCFRERKHLAPVAHGDRAFIIGAGEAGEELLRQLLHGQRHSLHVVGLIDDDTAKHGRSLHGVPVLGGADDLRALAAVHRAELALIAIPSANVEQLRRLVDRCTEAGVTVKLLPPFKDLVRDEVQVSQFRDIKIEDLLGREPVNLDLDVVKPDLAGRVALVTGAGGSIGAELARQIARFHPSKLVLIDRAESPLYFIHLEVSTAHPEIEVVPVLASVTNGARLERTFEVHHPHCVFHAAAYKQVPMLEANVVEAVWNNVIGTLRTARCAARTGTDKFVLISTDKAVNPTSILGASKLLAERVVLELPSLCSSHTDFRAVRFGNVLGSDGSVVPLFKRQLAEGGPLTVTHPEVRRYFMTIPEAVQLVLMAAALPDAAGRIALLEMGTQVRIIDLAEQLIRLAGLLPHKDIDITFTGLRPGEKMHEELVGPEETANPTSVEAIRVVEREVSQARTLARQLRQLTQVTAHRDEQALIRMLAGLVPHYQPPASPAGRGNGNGHPERRHGRRAPRPTGEQTRRPAGLTLTVPEVASARKGTQARA